MALGQVIYYEVGVGGWRVYIFSLPGRSPGRAIVLPPALALVALAKSLTLKFFM